MMPQVGELWRVRIRPVEWACPGCGKELHTTATKHDGEVVEIALTEGKPMIHNVDGCSATFPVPEGWIAYWSKPSPGYSQSQLCVLPYTLFEPLEAKP